MSIEAMKLALEVLTDKGQLHPDDYKEKKNESITALRTAIAEAEKPCPYIRSTAEGTHHCALSQRQPLTDEGIDAGVAAWFSTETVVGGRPFEKRMRAAIEAAHGIKEKNT